MPWLGFLLALGLAPFLAQALGRRFAPESAPRSLAAPLIRAPAAPPAREADGRAALETLFHPQGAPRPLDRALRLAPPFEARDAATLRGRLAIPGRPVEPADAPLVEVRLAGVEGPSRFAVCAGGAGLDPAREDDAGADEPGRAWACGLRARIGLVNLVAGRPLRCEPGPEGPGFRPAALPARGPGAPAAALPAAVLPAASLPAAALPAVSPPAPVRGATAGASPFPNRAAASRPGADAPPEEPVFRVNRHVRCTVEAGDRPFDVAREMVRAGWLRASEGGARHRPLEDEARAANRGAWSAGRFAAAPAAPAPTPPPAPPPVPR